MTAKCQHVGEREREGGDGGREVKERKRWGRTDREKEGVRREMGSGERVREREGEAGKDKERNFSDIRASLTSLWPQRYVRHGLIKLRSMSLIL